MDYAKLKGLAVGGMFFSSGFTIHAGIHLEPIGALVGAGLGISCMFLQRYADKKLTPPAPASNPGTP